MQSKNPRAVFATKERGRAPRGARRRRAVARNRRARRVDESASPGVARLVGLVDRVPSHGSLNGPFAMKQPEPRIDDKARTGADPGPGGQRARRPRRPRRRRSTGGPGRGLCLSVTAPTVSEKAFARRGFSRSREKVARDEARRGLRLLLRRSHLHPMPGFDGPFTPDTGA